MNSIRLGSVGLACLASVFVAGCHKERASVVDHGQCDAMYDELRGAYIAYADSMNLVSAGDSTEAGKNLAARFERRMHDIYRKYPADMDVMLSPDQNDTLWYYAQRYMQARSRVASVVSVSDTLAVDTVAVAGSEGHL